MEKVTTLEGICAELEGQLSRAELNRETALNLASEADSLDVDQSDELVRISTRLEVLKRKRTDAAGRLEIARSESGTVLGGVLSGFMILWRGLVAWTIEAEKARLLEGMIPGIDTLSLERVALFSKAVGAVRSLEPVGTDAKSVGEAARKLLAAVYGVLRHRLFIRWGQLLVLV